MSLMCRVALFSCIVLASACQHSSPSLVDSTGANRSQVIVIGAGVAGLVTAYELEKRGISTRLLEMREDLGGRVASIEYEDGLVAEAGLQELWEGNPLLKIASELGVELEDGADAYSSVVLDGVLYPYSQNSTEEYFASFLPSSERDALNAWMREAKSLHALAIERGLGDARIRALQDISFQHWIENAGLSERAATWIRLTLSCELATEWSNFSALFGLLEFHIFFDGGLRNYHVRGGNSRLLKALGRSVRGEKIYSAQVIRIERLEEQSGPRMRVFYQQHDRIHRLEADRVVLAVPFTHIHRIAIDPPLSAEHWKALTGLGMGRYVVVHLLMDASARALWTVQGQSSLVALSEGPLGVIYGPAAQVREDHEKLVFSLLIYGQYARAFHMAPSAYKLREIVDELDRLFPGFAEQAGPGFVYRYHPAAVATWPVGRSPLDEPSEIFRKPDRGLYFAGDWTLNAHSDGAATSGIRVAEKIAGDLAGRY